MLGLLEPRLLGSRFGRRLLALFVGCAIVPTFAVAALSFHSVRSQLSEQSWERLHVLSSAAGKTIYERLVLLEADLRKRGASLVTCTGAGREEGAALAPDCAVDILYGVDGLAWLPDTGGAVSIVPDRPELAAGAPTLPDLHPGQSAVVTASEPGGSRILLGHRPAGTAERGRLVASVTGLYLWGPNDLDALPAGASLTVWDPSRGVVLGEAADSLNVPPEVVRGMTRSATGAFEWERGREVFLATYWALPQTRRFELPPWRVILSEAKAEVVAPAAGFARTFPLLLSLSIVVVVVLGASQIRHSLVPLEELRQGTRLIANRQFDTRVSIASGDEIEELARSFNAMATRLGRQFSALTTAAEIDRAVLSAMDTSSIVGTVLARLPAVYPCEALAITLVDRRGEAATTWIESTPGDGRRVVATARLSGDDHRALRANRQQLSFGDAGSPLPAYLAHLSGDPGGPVEAFPLFYGEELLGVVALRRKAPIEADRDDLLQVRRLADQIAVALSNARMVEQVRFLAFYDNLTQLPNRVLHKQRLTEALVRARRLNRLVAVCFLDLDHFSRINDTLGHDLGDRLVQDVAARLLACCRAGDSVARLGGGDEHGVDVARLGGDEFTIVLPDIGEPQDAARVAQRVLATFDQPFRLGSQEVFVSASIGIAIYPFDGTDTDDLLKNADVAMYHAKEQGRNTYRMFSAAMNAEAVERMRTEQQLRRAIERGDFTMWYQPIVEVSSSQVVGAEALIRWDHPERGLVSPAEFMAISEESGLIVPLGEWILRTVCLEARAWEARGLGRLRMSVNLSARQLRDERIVDMVRAVLAETGLPPGSLVLELTESMLMEPGGGLAETLRALHHLGIALAIDDFGTGYSSLSYLKHFPVGSLKIDRSFVRDVTDNPDDAAIAIAIIALARALSLTVVAEGVETREQVEFLRAHGCDLMQGYLIGRPASAAEFAEALASGPARLDQLGPDPAEAGRILPIVTRSA